ncbi:hypothetical protein [Aliagarivorans marinus]|uniref:hypothetical protein n=1 Tax=Aliagarivorans marinus TaxID=561965 RepID=UPI00042120EB|nr:hypothetical protein [Aliagarivorans marinus]
MQKLKNSTSIINFLNEKQQGADAIFIVTDKDTGEHFNNNIYGARWKIKSNNNSTDYVDISSLDNSILSFEEQSIVRKTLAFLASKGRTVNNMLYAIVKVPLKSLDLIGAEDVMKGDGTIVQKTSVKAFFTALSTRYPSKYNPIRKALESYVIKNPKRNPWDIRTGALSRYEMVNLVTRLNEWSEIVLDEAKFTKWRESFGKGAGKITYVGKLNQFIGMRMAINFHLRPEQIKISLWSHFKNSSSEEDPFLFDGEGLFYPRYIKQQDDEVYRPVADPFPVSIEFSRELKIHYEKYFYWLKESIEKSEFSMSENEITDLMSSLPLIINDSIFEESKRHVNKKDYVSAMLSKSWLISKSYAKRLIDNCVAQLKPESDRLPASEYKVNSRRLRHYTGTVQSSRGTPVEQISISLTHSSLDAVKKSYIDLPADVQAQMDIKRSDSEFLVAAASGHFSEELKNRVSTSIDENEAVIEDLEAGNLGKSASLPMCRGCSKTKPISCYGCHSFHPLAEGNHRYYLGIVKKEYDAKKEAGFTGLQLAMYEHQMKKIKITIHYCDLAVKALESVSDENNDA